jgi:hypothetical protein
MPNENDVRVSTGGDGRLTVVVPAQKGAARWIAFFGIVVAGGIFALGFGVRGISPVGFFATGTVLALGAVTFAWFLGRYELKYAFAAGTLTITRRSFSTARWELAFNDIREVTTDNYKGDHWFVILTTDGRELRFGDGTDHAGYLAAATAMNDLLQRVKQTSNP